jgi:hypothetical protein
MKKFSLVFLGVAFVLGLSMSASAQVTMLYTGTVNGGIVNGDLSGPYTGTVNGGPTIDFVCDDSTPLNTNPWEANVGSSNPVSGSLKFTSSTLMPGATQQQLYNTITYLAMQILGNPSATVADEALNAAIWEITSNGHWMDPNAATDGTAADVALGIAADNSYNGDMIVYTPVTADLTTDQEFVTTPEPLSMALMGTFLTLAGLGLGKKKLFS